MINFNCGYPKKGKRPYIEGIDQKIRDNCDMEEIDKEVGETT